MLEVYMDDMIVKSSANTLYPQYLGWVFKRVWQYNMRLNSWKYTFIVRAKNVLGLYLEEWGI